MKKLKRSAKGQRGENNHRGKNYHLRSQNRRPGNQSWEERRATEGERAPGVPMPTTDSLLAAKSGILSAESDKASRGQHRRARS